MKILIYSVLTVGATLLVQQAAAQPRSLGPSSLASRPMYNVFVQIPYEDASDREAAYKNALARAIELDDRLSAALAEAQTTNTALALQIKPICTQLGGTADDNGNCVFPCPPDDPSACQARTEAFNRQAAPLLVRKRDMITNLKLLAGLVRAAKDVAVNKKQLWEQSLPH